VSTDRCGFAGCIDAVAGNEFRASGCGGVVHDATEVLFGVSCEEAFEQPLVTSPRLSGSQGLE